MSMNPHIRCAKVNHLNMVLQDFDESLNHFRKYFGADLLYDIPRPELHAGVIDIGRVLFEFFVPHEFLLNARYGPHYLGIEYQADMRQVREVLAAQRIRIARDIGDAVHTHPADCFGIAFEFYAGEFHDRHYETLGRKLHPASYWRDRHPLGLTGLIGYTVAVADLPAASRFFQTFLGAEPAYETARDAAAGHAIGLTLAGSTVELITPSGEGEISRYLHRYGNGIRSAILGVRNLHQARHHFIRQGLGITQSTHPNGFAIPAEDNLGVIFEFVEGSAGAPDV